jgi:hypothetical protein
LDFPYEGRYTGVLAVGVSGVSGGVIRADRCMELHAWQGPRVIFATGNRFWYMLILIVVIPKALRVARTGIRAARRGEARSSTPPVQSGDLLQLFPALCRCYQ